MHFEREIDMPFDVISLDGFTYMLPHGIRIKTEPLIKAGIDKIKLISRNIFVNYSQENEDKIFEDHPILPVDEYLMAPGVPPVAVRFSKRLLDILGITIETIYEYYSSSDDRLKEIDPSQLSISKGKLCIGETLSDPMMVVWNGVYFCIMPKTSKLKPSEEAVEDITGSLIGNKFRCKYGIFDVIWN